MKRRNRAHEFALYSAGLSGQGLKEGQELILEEKELIHRITHVLRLTEQGAFILFDRHVHVRCIITTVSKKTVTVIITSYTANQRLMPSMTILLPLLKRDALEEAIYTLVEVGATQIQLVTTTKAWQKWHGQKERLRLEQIAIAAAEQSKQYAFAQLKPPINFAQALEAYQSDVRLAFVVDGQPLFEVITQLRDSEPKHLVVSVGPEADFTEQERFELKQQQFILTRLTPTVLRARQAVTVGVGALRSLLRK